jgi:hypothetical protein
MIALSIRQLTADWTAAKWLLWIVLYISLGILMPALMTRSWGRQHGKNVPTQLGQLFQHGELGLVALMLAISVIWDLQRSLFSSYTIALSSVFLALTGIMAASVWIESYCRRSTGTQFSPVRAWRDSRNLALLVFSLTLVTEILLDRLAKVTTL